MFVNYLRKSGMRFEGEPTFLSTSAWFDSTEGYSLITLSEGCNISRDVRVLTHDWSPWTAARGLRHDPDWPLGRTSPVYVGPHAFIGLGAVLLAGASIGQGAIVGAGTVVRGTVPDHAIVVGNPMQIVGSTRTFLAKNYPGVAPSGPEEQN